MLDKGFLDKFREVFKGTALVAPLKKLMKLGETETVKFGDFVNDLKNARTKVIEQIEKQEQNSDDVHHFFLKILDIYVSQLRSSSGCPRNVIPIYVYQNHLLGYTDAEYDNLSNQIRELEIYKNFENACLKLLK